MEEQAGLSGQYPGSFRHGDGNCQSKDALNVDGSQLSEADGQILDALAHVVEASGPFSFGLLTNTLSVTEQLDFSYQLIALAGRIRARVEKAAGDNRRHTTDSTHGDTP